MANKQYFKKDKKAQIYKRVPGHVDEYGDRQDAYRPVAPAPLWCYAKQLSEQQKFIAQSMSIDETRLFVFNYRNDVEVYDKILYKGVWYEVTRVDTLEDYNGELFVYVNDCPRGSKPGDDEILPYEPPKQETTEEESSGGSHIIGVDEYGDPIYG